MRATQYRSALAAPECQWAPMCQVRPGQPTNQATWATRAASGGPHSSGSSSRKIFFLSSCPPAVGGQYGLIGLHGTQWQAGGSGVQAPVHQSFGVPPPSIALACIVWLRCKTVTCLRVAWCRPEARAKARAARVDEQASDRRELARAAMVRRVHVQTKLWQSVFHTIMC
jgi:hypothetical protein